MDLNQCNASKAVHESTCGSPGAVGNMTWDSSDLFPTALNLLVIFLQVICDLRLVGLGCPGQMGGCPSMVEI